MKRVVKKPNSSEKVDVTDKKQIAFENYSFFKKEIVGDKTIYHSRLMNILKVLKALENKLSVIFH
ncbi:hypothetical protein [Borreliella bavariensis]|uniref:hypothetical protein n=1 Tax=Borreliella bavariensis TaxID=664662 RepID=UPI001F165A17|nr:hypothetical protein [Borreliella bavariensis]